MAAEAGGLLHVKAAALARDSESAGAVATLQDLDPTQRSFAEHICAWCEACKSRPELFDSDLPLLATPGSGVGVQDDADANLELGFLCGPVLLLGTGAGKTTPRKPQTLPWKALALRACGLSGDVGRSALGVSAGDGTASLLYAAMGQLFLSRMQPANALHPHLRGPMEFHISVLLARRLTQQDLDRVKALDFLEGAGVRFLPGPGGWVRALPRNKDAHTAWGERTQPAWDECTQCFQLVRYACPFALHKARRVAAV